MISASVGSFPDADENSASRPPSSPQNAVVVDIPWETLSGRRYDALFEQAYGTDGLGILTVSGIPNLANLRGNLLQEVHILAGLPRENLLKYEVREADYTLGWSQGKERLENGQPDTHKGSYYAVPVKDYAAHDSSLIAQMPQFCRENVWPDQEVPGLREAFFDLADAMIVVGRHVAELCDRFVSSRNPEYRASRIVRSVARQEAFKGRMLHYFPVSPQDTCHSGDHWCGWHTDTGSLTGLVAAQFMQGDIQVPSPNDGSGLHVKNRKGVVFRVTFPSNRLAFQIGEVMQILSGGILKATPHYVKAGSTPGVSRDTFALFMQPWLDEVLDPPCGCGREEVEIGEWLPGMTFGTLAQRTFRKTSRDGLGSPVPTTG
eukprot:jgi/Botrbrau1/1933/Bobra.0005s0032.2